jgi:hypothetical protein
MTARSIRRAAERKANKLARKAAAATPAPCCAEIEPIAEPHSQLSSARLAANLANSQLSTGPRTDAGKAKVSLNAVKTGLTGCTVLLPSDDAAEYERHILAYEKDFAPAGLQESALVQSLADIAWRLNRIPGLEMAIYASGRIQFADLFEDQPSAARANLIDLHTHLTYEKQLRNLQLQEARLVRRREKETAELRRLQQERKAKEVADLEETARPNVAAKQAGQNSHLANHGFEFSNPAIESLTPNQLEEVALAA